jgi:hypothetical protein
LSDISVITEITIIDDEMQGKTFHLPSQGFRAGFLGKASGAGGANNAGFGPLFRQPIGHIACFTTTMIVAVRIF